MAEDGRAKKRKQGGMKTMPFILGNEICDRFAAAGFNANMVSYLTTELHMPLVESTNTLNNFSGTSSLTPIIGALIADSFAGRFWTITVGSIVYQLGMILLTISAVLPSMRPPPCPTEAPTCERANSWQLTILYTSLLLTAIGTGGIRPCVVAFGADQFDLDNPRPEKPRKWNFFNLYFFAMGLAVLLALTVVVYIQDNVSWGWGFGIPSIAMFLSVVAFVIGYPMYKKMKPGGTPLTRLSQVVVAAVKKRKVEMPEDHNLLYVNKEMDADISTTGRLLHTDQLRFLDKAAIITSDDLTPTGEPIPWRISTVHRVEELKSLIRMLPIWSAGILLVTASSHNYTLTIMQAKLMNRHVTSHFQIPAATLSIFGVASMLLSLALYDRILVPIFRKFTHNPTGITYLQRMGIGIAISLFSNISSAMVETKRRSAAESGVLLSAFWLVPQYAIGGLADTFGSVGHMEFLYDQAPESMRSTAAALFWLSMSIGSYLGTAMVSVVNDTTDWLQDDINKGHLNYYYWMVFGLQVFNLVYYVVCVRFYTFKPLEVSADVVKTEEDGEVELAEYAA